MARRRTLGFSAIAILMLFSPPVRADHPGAGFGQTISGPVVTIPAGTLPAGRWAASIRLEWIRFDSFSDTELESFAAADEEVHSVDGLVAPSLGIACGVTNQLTIGARIPHVTRRSIREGHLEAGIPEVQNHGDSRGTGDLTILGQYRLTRGEGPRQLALLGGIKAPVGETDVASDGGDRFEIDHQPGTGSWDALIGAAWTSGGPAATLDANVLASLTSKGERDTRLGNLVGWNVALSRPMVGARDHEHPEGGEAHQHHRPRLDLVAELNGEWRARTEIAGVEEENSGGSMVYLAPGARYMTGDRWSFSVSVGFPVLQDLGGIQHETSVRSAFGIGVLF